MELRSLKRKKGPPLPPPISGKFPRPYNGESYIGFLTGNGVSIFNDEVIRIIYDEGNFGKGSLSKSEPNFNPIKDDIPRILMQQQWENHLNWEQNSYFKKDDDKLRMSTKFENAYMELATNSMKKFLDSCYFNVCENSWKNWKREIEQKSNESRVCQLSSQKIGENIGKAHILSDLFAENQSDINIDLPFNHLVEEILKTRKLKEAGEFHMKKNQSIILFERIVDNFVSVKPQLILKSSSSQIKEVLKLNFCEAFFLCFLGSLKILNSSDNEIEITDLWKKFCEADNTFLEKYIVYHHFRSYGWAVKSGLKFGGDYLLYKVGPAYYHANFLLWIIDKRKKMTWNEFVALNRLVETFNKDLLFCVIIGPDLKSTLYNVNMMSQFSILQIMSKRWVPSQERGIKKNS